MVDATWETCGVLDAEGFGERCDMAYREAAAEEGAQVHDELGVHFIGEPRVAFCESYLGRERILLRHGAGNESCRMDEVLPQCRCTNQRLSASFGDGVFAASRKCRLALLSEIATLPYIVGST